MGAPFGGAQKAELSAVCKLPPSAFGTFPRKRRKESR
jgi:hypothetical protein